jgi:2-keto-4-pentenoate hydratase/2-oxohepta-3-ene-1,7-dioic acid hydratase in catechol pathway
MANVGGRAHLVRADGRAVDIGRASGGVLPADPMELIEHWDRALAWAGPYLAEQAAGQAPGQVGSVRLPDGDRLGPPVPRPRQVFAVASNYRDRPAVVPGGADLPVVFTKFPSSITRPGADLPLPTATVDWEVEIVAVVGRRASGLTPEQGWAAVAGLTVGQDFSERTLQLGGAAKQFSLGKSFPAFGPIGPVLVSPDELRNPDRLRLTCEVNGEVVQDGDSAAMIHRVPDLVSALSRICELHPGDLIFTGTPAGLGMSRTPPRYLRPGDVVTSRVEGIGGFRTTCVSP